MWMIFLLAGFLFFIGLAMWLCGADNMTILMTLAIIAAVCFYLFLAACLELVAVICAVNGCPMAHLLPFGFLAFVGLVHWRAFKR